VRGTASPQALAANEAGEAQLIMLFLIFIALVIDDVGVASATPLSSRRYTTPLAMMERRIL